MRVKMGWLLTLAALALAALCVFAFQKFSGNETAHMMALCERQLGIYAQQNASGICGELENGRKNVALAGTTFAAGDVVLSEDALKTLRLLLANTSFNRMFLSDANGNSMSNTGSFYQLSDRAFYQRAMRGESTILLDKSSDDGKNYIIISAPVIANGKVIGAVHGELALFPLFKIMNQNSFDGMGYAAMIDTNGNYVIFSANSNEMNTSGENFFTWVQQATLSGGQSEQSLREALRQSDSGHFSLSLKTEKRAFYYVPVGINNWYLLQQVSSAYVEEMVSPIRKSAMILIAEISACILAAVAMAVLYIRKGRREREATAAKFIALANNIPGGVFEAEVGSDFVVRYANEGFYTLVGYSKAEYQGGNIRGHGLKIVCSSDESKLLESFNQQIASGNTVSAEMQIIRKNGEIRWVSMTGTVIGWNQDSAIVQAILMDITLQKEQTKRIVENAKMDKMTQLYDKVSATELISSILKQKGVNALVILDIDNFKHVNDSFGHSVGDKAIIMIANTLKKYFRSTDIIGRIGGDEFIVCLRDVPDEYFVKTKLDHFLERVRELTLIDSPGALSCSAGCVVVQNGMTDSFDTVFQAADRCLYSVKKSMKGKAAVRMYECVKTNNEEGQQ